MEFSPTRYQLVQNLNRRRKKSLATAQRILEQAEQERSEIADEEATKGIFFGEKGEEK